jgi:predicted dehydrogenase
MRHRGAARPGKNRYYSREETMHKPVKIGIVGASWWADLMFLPSLQSHPGAQVAALCARSRDRVEALARKYGVPRVYTDYRQLIDQGKLDALVVAAPDDLHYPVVMHALDAGLHVLCEKPMAMTAGQAREMLEKAEAVGVKHMILFTWRWMPHFQTMHRLVAGGYIGRGFHADFQYLAGYARRNEYMWRFDRRRANGVLGDLGSHMIHFAHWLVGDIVKVNAHLASFVERPGDGDQPPDPANDSALLIVEFASGAHGAIQVSAVSQFGERDSEQHISLFGEAGSLRVDVAFFGREAGAGLFGARGDADQFQAIPVPDELWQGVDRSSFAAAQVPGLFTVQPIGPRLFIDSILEDKPASPNFYDGFKVQQVIDAALQSHQTGRQVSIP